jgi:glycosyltransferase involved in cell wall biosynthesis
MVHGWPRLSMTFVAQELVGLEEQGIPLLIATYGEPDAIRHPIHDRVKADILRLPKDNPPRTRLLAAWRKVRRMPGYRAAKAAFRAELLRGVKRSRWRAFARGMILAAELPSDVRLIYAHFINSATQVARYAALITGLPLAASAHARDIWTANERDKRNKLAAMQWCATCTSLGADHLRGLSERPENVHLIYHGLDFSRFPVEPPRRDLADGSDSGHPVLLLSVGRRWRHVGEGKILQQLKGNAAELGLSDRIEWLDARDQQFVIKQYRGCDLFVLPCREAADGDRDGLPNVLMEAQSQALACLSTNFSEIPELIKDGQTGVLVPPAKVAPLSQALERLIRSPAERDRLGLAGYHRVRSEFEAEGGIKRIAALLRSAMT